MIFADLFFLYAFLPPCILLYFLFSNVNYKNFILVVFSLIFYAFGEPFWIIILLLNVTANYFFSLIIAKNRDRPIAKIGVALSLLTSLSVLGVFKYSGFVAENLNLLLPIDIPVPDIGLPIGISFYTFQIISYILDCYWGKVEVNRNYLKFFTYVSMFPQLAAGPIVRYNLVEQALSSRKTDIASISIGITRFAVGLGKKVIIANNLSTITDTFLGGDIASLSVFGSWYGVIIYALQIYFDFSGYSDMAIGLGYIFGFRFNENFNYPFICKNITEFWQRWHISLGSFFRDYLLYVPIFGKRRQYASLFIVWFCTGLWHGASWNFVIWGMYFGIFIFLERKIGNKRMKKIPKPLLHIYNKIIIIVGFGIFYFTDINTLGIFLRNLIGSNNNSLTDQIALTSFTNNIFLIIIAILFSFPIVPLIKDSLSKYKKGFVLWNTIEVVSNLSLIIISSVLLVNATNNPFLYFNF